MRFTNETKPIGQPMAAESARHRQKGRCRFGLRVGDLRQSILYQPLALFLVLLLLPPISWLESGAGQSSGSARPFQASAQIVTGSCKPQYPNAIIQVVCPGGQFYAPDLYQLESDSVAAYLSLYNLPASEAQLIYSTGRSDLRNAIRATIFSELGVIINKPASQRSQHEQNLYNWLQTLVQQNEIAEYTSAINAYHQWVADPCDFKLDSDIASQYGLSYNGAPFCGASLTGLFLGPPVPAESYFLAYGMKNSYGAPSQSFPNFASLTTATQLNTAAQFGIALSTGAVTASAFGALVAALVPQVTGFGAGAAQAASGAFAVFVSGVTADSLGVFVPLGAASIVLVAVMTGIVAAMQTFNNKQTINQLNDLGNTLYQVTNTPPDLSALFNDSGALGQLKLVETFTAQTLPDMPGAGPLPSHQSTDPTFAITPLGAITGTPEPVLSYRDWNAISWSAQTAGGWFVQTCNSGASCPQATSFSPSIQYLDWIGTQWTAGLIGTRFVHVKAKPASTDQPCPADPATGVSPGLDFSACLSYVSDHIPMSNNGNQVSVSLTKSPAFTNTNTTLSFTVGRSGASIITASGAPLPSIALQGSLPAGLTFSAGNGMATLSYDGTTPDGTYPMTLVANNGVTSVSQTFAIQCFKQLAITSPAQYTATAGLRMRFLVTTTGDLPIQLSITPSLLPPGLTFTDNGDGTATIQGTPGIFTSNCVTTTLPGGNQPCGITATNASGSVLQPFVLGLATPPQATLVGAASAMFSAGAPNSVLLASQGAITPVHWDFNVLGSAPSWLSFKDNGDGTGVLSGTPPAGTEGSYSFPLSPESAGNADVVLPFTLYVKDVAGFLTPSIANFTVGAPVNFEIQTNGPSAEIGNATLPAGLTFTGGNPAYITGTPAAGTGGASTVLLTATDSRGTGTQLLTMKIKEAPQITSAPVATFPVGGRSSFAVTTLGYPNLSTQPASTLKPGSPDLGMTLQVQGLPLGFTATNLNPQGYNTGTLAITGTPTSDEVGVHRLSILASNGVGSAIQDLYISVVETAPAPSSSNTCDGIYNGTFNGSLNVQLGQTCTFISGGVTGNIMVSGGKLTLRNAQVGGAIQLQGVPSNIPVRTGFDIENSRIAGSLTINSVNPSAAPDQVCGSAIQGELIVTNNLTPVQIGGACPGNTVGGKAAVENNMGNVVVQGNQVTGGDLGVLNNGGSAVIQGNTVTNGDIVIANNTGQTQVFGDATTRTLSCSSNTNITGGQDKAQTLTDQCAGF